MFGVSGEIRLGQRLITQRIVQARERSGSHNAHRVAREIIAHVSTACGAHNKNLPNKSFGTAPWRDTAIKASPPFQEYHFIAGATLMAFCGIKTTGTPGSRKGYVPYIYFKDGHARCHRSALPTLHQSTGISYPVQGTQEEGPFSFASSTEAK